MKFTIAVFALAISLCSVAGIAQAPKPFSEKETCLKGLEEAYSVSHLRPPFVYENGILVMSGPKGLVAYSSVHEIELGAQGVSYDPSKKIGDGLHLLLKDFAARVDDKSLQKNQKQVNEMISCMFVNGSDSQAVVKSLLVRAGLVKQSDINAVQKSISSGKTKSAR